MKMNRLPLFAQLSAALLIAWPSAASAAVGPFYVDPIHGVDSNTGTSPHEAFHTIEHARDVLRPLLAGMDGDVKVILKGGQFALAHTLVFGPQDSGCNGHRVVYCAADGETPVISGGRRVNGWRPVPGKPYVVADVPVSADFADYFRQLYVDGERMPIAMGPPIKGTAFFDDPDAPTPPANPKFPDRHADGIVFPDAAIPNPLTNVTDVRLFHIAIAFKIEYMPVVSIERKNGQCYVRLLQPQFQARLNRDNGASMNFDQNFYVMNALEVLNTPGQWYLDRAGHRLFYYPKPGQDMARAEAYVPAVDTLVSITGTPEQRVANLELNGLTFEYGNWLWPKDQYLGGTQAEILMVTDPQKGPNAVGYGGEVPGEISIGFAHDIGFRNNVVRHMGSGGLHCSTGVQRANIEGNLFYDTTAAGIIAGRWNDANPPLDRRTSDLQISNNLVADTGDDFFPATGISVMNTYGVSIIHNRVVNTSFMGIHQRRNDQKLKPEDVATIGKSTIEYNECINNTAKGPKWKVGDSGAIYSFGPWPGTVVSHNYVHGVTSWKSYYSDDNSFDIRWSYNVGEDKPFHFPRSLFKDKAKTRILASHNYSREPLDKKPGVYKMATFDADGPPHIVPIGAPWPPEAQAIIDQAGLDPAHRFLIKKYESMRR